MNLLLTIFIGIGFAQLLHLHPLLGALVATIYYLKKQVNKYTNWQGFSFQSTPSTFHQHLFSLLGYIAKADGIISSNEIKSTQSIMDALCLNYSQKSLAKSAFKKGSQGLNLNSTITYLKILNFSRPDLVQQVFSYCEQIIHADTFKSREQINILNQIKFHIQQNTGHQHQSRQHYTRPRTHLHDAYKLLDISPSMDFATMKKTYRKLVGKHHPDRQRSEALRKQAEEKIKSMQQAWNTIKQHHEKETA